MADEKIIGFRIVGVGNDAQDYVKRVRDEVRRLKADAKDLGPIINLPNGKELDLTTASLAQLKRAVRELSDSGRDVDSRLVTKIAEMKQRQDEVNSSIKDTTKLLKESSVAPGSYRALNAELVRLRASYKELGEEARKGFPGKELQRRIQELDGELKDIDATIGQFQRNVGNYGSAFDRLGGLLQGAGLAVGLQEIVGLNAQLSDSLGSVQKATDLTTDEVNELRAALEARDTRTNIFDQLDIARIGGQLGVAKDQLEGFTESVDKANIALGDDLGGTTEEIAQKLGRLQAILVNDEDGVGKGIERIGSAINELGKQGPNTGDFLTDFSNRLAGTARVAGITAPQLLGLGAALQESGVSSEVASTSLNKFLVEIGKNEDQFASFAEKVGITRDRFAELVRNSPNDALLAVLEGARNTEGGLAGLNQLLEDLGISGSGSARTLAALASNIDLVRDRQETSNRAFDEATSLANEFKIQNQTLAANLEKLKNQFIALVTESGILEFLTSASKGLLQFTQFVKENAVALGIAGAALVALNPKLAANLVVNSKLGKVIKSNTILQAAWSTAQSVGATVMGLLTGKVKLATIAQRALNLVMSLNPIGLVVTAVGLLIAGFVALYNRSETLRAGIAGTFAAIKTVITNFVGSVKTRLGGFAKVLTGAFTLDLDTVKEGLRDLRQSFTQGTVGLAEGVGEAFNEAYAAKMKEGGEEAAGELNAGLSSQLGELEATGADAGERVAKTTIESLRARLSQEQEKLGKIELGTPEFANQKRLVDDLQAQLDRALGRGRSGSRGLNTEVEVKPKFTGPDFTFDLEEPVEEEPVPDFIDVEATKEKMKERLEAIEESLNQEILALRQAQFDGLKTEEEVEEEKLRLRAEYLRKKADLIDGTVADDTSIQAAALDAEFALYQFYEDRRTNAFEEAEEARTQKAKEEAEKREQARQRYFDEGLKVVEQGQAIIANIAKNRVNQEERQELKSLEERYSKRIEAAEGNEAAQARLEREFEAKKERIQAEAAQKRKEIAKKETIINAAVAAVKTFANLGFPAALPALAGLAIVTGLQLKAIEEQEFAQGGDMDAGPSAPSSPGAQAPVSQAPTRPAASAHSSGYAPTSTVSPDGSGIDIPHQGRIVRFSGGKVSVVDAPAEKPMEVVAGGSISPSGQVYGRSHSGGGVKAVYKGRRVELEGGERVVQNGPEAYVINKRSVRAFGPQLAAIAGNRSSYSPERRALASAINSANGWGVPFASGGPLDVPQVATPAPPEPSPNVVNTELFDRMDERMSLVEDFIDATNGRIDRIEVIADPKKIVESGVKQLAERKTFG